MAKKCTALHSASGRGCLDAVISLVNNGVDIDERCDGDYCNNGSTALLNACESILHACERERKDVAEFLIEAGANIHLSGGCGKYTALHLAAQNGWVDMVQTLLDKGADIEVQSERGDTPLCLAVDRKQKDVVKLLVDAGADIHLQFHFWNYTLLHFAAKHGWYEIAQILVNRGVDIHFLDNAGKTPLHLAAENNHIDVMDLLIDAGADINSGGKFEWTILHEAAAWNGSVPMVQFLLDKGADIQVKSANGFNALLWATKCHHKDVAELLMNAGSDIFCSGGCNQKTLLHYAAENGWLDMVQHLVKKGLQLEAKSRKGKTPLQIAIGRHAIEVFKYLISAGADINVGSSEGNSPLSHTLFNSWRPTDTLVRLIIEGGAYVTPDDYEGIVENPSLKEPILQDIELCSQALINEFNRKDLPKFYNMYAPFKDLPCIEGMHIENVVSSTQSDANRVTYEVIQSVKHEIETKGHCDLPKARPIALKMLAVKSFLVYSDAIKTRNNHRKRSAEYEICDQQSKWSQRRNFSAEAFFAPIDYYIF